jgi:hypothetical protein
VVLSDAKSYYEFMSNVTEAVVAYNWKVTVSPEGTVREVGLKSSPASPTKTRWSAARAPVATERRAAVTVAKRILFKRIIDLVKR